MLAGVRALGQSFSSNLIANPGAEAGISSLGRGEILVPIPGWSTTDKFTVIAYGTDNWPSAADPGPDDRGHNLFIGGTPSNLSTAIQAVDVSVWSGAIDGSGVTYQMSGWLGGWSDQNDNAAFSATFLGLGDVTLGSAAIGPVTATDRGGITSLLYRETSGILPTGTREIQFVLTMTRTMGIDNEGYADNLSFVATAVPEPESIATIGCLGLVAFALGWRRIRP